MRGWSLGAMVLLLGFLAAPPAPAAAACEEGECGVPQCWSPEQRVRPGMPRKLYFSCARAVGVKVLSGPAHGTISDVSQEWGLVRFTIRADEDAPRFDEVVFEIAGEWESIEQRIPIEVKPLAENAPPQCFGAEGTKRSDGKGPVDVYLNPWCYDPDGDEFTATGSGPGVHLDAPMAIASNHTLSYWNYRTAIHTGTEVAQLHATDILDAKSEPVDLKVTVGPDIDRLVACGVNYAAAAYWDGIFEIRSRPGVPRRFGIHCGDPDGDPFVAAPSEPPSRGVFAPVLTYSTLDPNYSAQQFDATYAPAGPTMEPDEFAMSATGTRGGTQMRMRIVPRALPENGGGWCGWGGVWTLENTPGTGTVECEDEEGDALSAEMVEPPQHGTAGPMVSAPGLYGTTRIEIPYVPAPGFVGYDCMKIEVTDGHGFEQTILVEVQVQKLVEAPLPSPPDLPLPIPLPGPLPGGPGSPPMPRATVDALVRTYAQQVLDTPAVKRLPNTGNAHVWAPARLSKAELLRDGVEPAMVVVCPRGCRLHSRAELFSGSRARARRSRQDTAHDLSAGLAHLLWMTVGQDQRPELRKARRARATFRLGLRPHAARPRSVRRAIPVER